MAQPTDDDARNVSDLHTKHYRIRTPVQRALDRAVARLSHPAHLFILTFFVFGWIIINLAMVRTGGNAFDPPPFQWLECAASVAAVYMTVLILTAQHREDEVARYRDQLTLELAILAERKTAKVIALLEEIRRDNPLVRDRFDEDASVLSRPADPDAVLEAIETIHRTVKEL